MISLKASTEIDACFVDTCCSIKGLAVSCESSATPGTAIATTMPVMSYKNIQVRGLASIILAIEAMKPQPSLFPNGNIGMPLGLLHWRNKMLAEKHNPKHIQANAQLIERQLSDSRLYLQGALPGLADAIAMSWLLPLKAKVKTDAVLSNWLARMERIMTKLPPSTAEKISLNDWVSRLKLEPLLKINSSEDNKHTVTCMLD